MIQDYDFKYRAKREAMAAELEKRGITNKRVLSAIAAVKRHLFLDTMGWDSAYDDNAYPIGSSQTISQPYTVAFMTQIVTEHYPAGRLLEIGTGSGYQAAVLAHAGYQVFTIERISALYEKSKKIFTELGIRLTQRLGDGSLGWNEMSPFDAILVTAGAPEAPQSLLRQLKSGGRLIIPVGNAERQQMMVYLRDGDTVYESVAGEAAGHQASFAFVPLIGKEGWSP